ncbi:MAG: transporter ATP-binding protein [Ilumatobacteraceae bacterium]|nr:transporter ATP-binding protein [Ilumatobacteraceae bacterium]
MNPEPAVPVSGPDAGAPISSSLVKPPILVVEDLRVTFQIHGAKALHAVDGVSFEVRAGETVGIVGESGSGKSVTSLAILGLLPARGVTVTGSIKLDGEQLLHRSERAMQDIRGRRIAMVFQDPMSSLNPVLTVGRQIGETIRRHQKIDRTKARIKAAELLDRVGIPEPMRRLGSYPHQLSGGMRQRVMIAIALATEPALLIADEPTTALDVTIQAQVLDLLRSLVSESDTALIMITHDLGVVAGMCNHVNVMYSGRIVETGQRYALFGSPRHHYTRGLLASVPRLDGSQDRLQPIPGSPSDTIPWSQGCAFSPRCPAVIDACLGSAPELVTSEINTRVRCVNPAPPTDAMWAPR